MSETKMIFEQVKRTATKAIQAERKGDLEMAFSLFLRAAELLNKLITLERSQKIRDSYYTKAKEYISKAKELRIIIDGSKIESTPDLPSPKKKDLPSPPKPSSKPKTPPPPPPPKDKKTSPPPKDDKPPLPPPPKDEKKTTSLPPPPSSNITGKMMRGEDEEQSKDKTPPPPTKTEEKRLPPKKEVEMPTKTTYEQLLEKGKYRECIIECTKSVEAELRVRLGLFDEQLTLGMLIQKGIEKGIESLKEFRFVNILNNRIAHENYRPKMQETERAVDITTKILMS